MIRLTFSLKQLTLRKIAIENIVKKIPRSVQCQERDSKSDTIKQNSIPCKQNKNISQNNNKFFKNIAVER